MAKHILFTTGYSGHDTESFVDLLREHEISLVIDVRRNPVSRKKGFSRTALSEHLREKGLEYQHVADLGVPQPLRNALRDGTCGLAAYLRRFRTYVVRQAELLDTVYNWAIHERCCLLCVEACSDECHRSVIADEVVTRNGRKVKIVHI